MSAGGINYSIGGDASGLGRAFQHALRFTGDFTDQLKRAFSVRGLFDGLASGLTQALGGNNLGEVFGNALKKASGKEVLQQNFAGLLGGDEKLASAAIDALQAFAGKSGIAADELNDAARTLIASGGANAARAVEDIQMLGEVARSTQRPIGELATVWAKMFSDGAVSSLELKGLLGAGVNIEALAKAAGMTGEEFKKLATDGELSFNTVANAMKALTTTGIYAGQIDRFKGTFIGIAGEIQTQFQKIPAAFFSGIIGAGAAGAKESLRDISSIVEGWGLSARQFGEQLGAALTVAKQLNEENKLFGTDGLMATALEAGFGMAANALVSGSLGAASGFVAVLQAGIPKVFNAVKTDVIEIASNFADTISEALGFGPSQKKITPSPVFSGSMPQDVRDAILNNPQLAAQFEAAQDAAWARSTPGKGEETLGKIFRDAFNKGSEFDLGAGADAKKRLAELLEGRMTQALGGAPRVMDAVMQVISAFTSIPLGRKQLGLANEAEEPGNFGGRLKFDAPNAMAKVGMFVGAGGPQGAFHHQQEIAKNTGKMTAHMDKIARELATAPVVKLGVFR